MKSVEVGVTDIGPELRALHLETFQRITGVNDRKLDKIYLNISWDATKYIRVLSLRWCL